MIATVSKIVFGLMTMVIVAGAVFLAYVWGGGNLPAPATPPTMMAEQRSTPTRYPVDDRGADTGRQYATALPANAPLNMATAEAYSLSVYATAVASSALPDPPPAPVWDAGLPDCSSGQTPCTFTYSNGPPAPAAPNLATGGTNEGTDAHPQKDTDQAASFEGDKP